MTYVLSVQRISNFCKALTNVSHEIVEVAEQIHSEKLPQE